MRRRELDNLLEQAVADALGLDRPTHAARSQTSHGRTSRHHERARAPLLITASHRRVAQHA